MFNALQAIQAGELGKQHKAQADYKNALSVAGNSALEGDYGAAANALMPHDLNAGMQMMQFGQQQDQMKAQQADAQRTQQLHGALSLTDNMLQIPEAQRGQWLMDNWQAFAPYFDNKDFMTFWNESGGDVSDATLQQEMGVLRTQLGIGAPAAQASSKPIEIDGRLVDPNTFEVLYEPPSEPEKGPEPMTPYQVAQMAHKNAELALKRQEFEASQRPDYSDIPPAFQPPAGAPYPELGPGVSAIPASFGQTLTPFDEFMAGERGGADEQPRDLAMYNKYRGSSMAKADTDRLDDINQRSIAILNTQMPKLQQMSELLDAGAKIGPMAGARVEMAKWGVGGPFSGQVLTKEEAAQLETFNNLSTDLRLELTSKTKGAISDKEWADFARAVPNWNQTPEGAKMMIRAYEQINDRWLVYQDAANEWSSYYGGLSVADSSGKTFDQYWQKYTRNNPMNFSMTNSMRDVLGAAKSAANERGWSSNVEEMSDDDLLSGLGLN